MNQLTDYFPQILSFAKDYGLPASKKRGILREYLQTKIIESIYRKKISARLFFIGGTSLRLLHGLDRFSEDLDFDMKDLSNKDILNLINDIASQLNNENINTQIYKNITKKRSYFEFKFPDLLHQLDLSQNREEKLMIKFDFENYWNHQEREIILLNKYGFVSKVVTINKNQLIAQKLHAYLNRKQTLSRDLYDIVWLISQGAKIDREFCKHNKIPKNLISQAIEKFSNEKKQLSNLKRKLIPFLINEDNIEKIDLFPDLITKLDK